MFSRPYKFLVHCVIHALSHLKGAYDEPSDYIMNIITCLVLNRHYNISQVIFDHMVDNVKGEKYIMYPRFIQMFIDDQVRDLPKDPTDELDPQHMKSETLSRLGQYKGLKKEESEPRARRMICKIGNRNYVAPENDAWRHENSNSEDESGRLIDMHVKKLRYWFVKEGKRKRTPKASPTVTAPKVSTPKIVNEEAEAAKAAKIAESSKNVQEESVKEKDPEGVAHTDSSDADDESTETEFEIDKSKIGVGKVTLKKKPLKKKKKGSDDEDETYIPTPQAEKKKFIKKRKAVQTGVIPRSVRARKGSASMPELQSGKGPVVEAGEVQTKSIPVAEVQNVEKPEDEKEKVPESPEYVRIKKKGVDDEVVITGERVTTPPPPKNPTTHILVNVETPNPKKTTLPGLFDGFPNIQGEFIDDILTGGDYDMFHDATIKELTKKVSLLEKEKVKADAERDELKKQLKKINEMNEEMKSVVKNHAKRIKTLVEDVDDNAKLFE
ncbi:hypothetical protein HanIR_Chr14g0685461 [Helianthus annuus]|nr:hypothetical protein HanIR_Chr14g0685461 [Helianthus annuus]